MRGIKDEVKDGMRGIKDEVKGQDQGLRVKGQDQGLRVVWFRPEGRSARK